MRRRQKYPRTRAPTCYCEYRAWALANGRVHSLRDMSVDLFLILTKERCICAQPPAVIWGADLAPRDPVPPEAPEDRGSCLPPVCIIPWHMHVVKDDRDDAEDAEDMGNAA